MAQNKFMNVARSSSTIATVQTGRLVATSSGEVGERARERSADMGIDYRLTAQGQVSVPAEVRKRLGIGPGSVIEWELEGDKLVVRRASKYTLQDLHSALFPKGAPARKTGEELREGVRKHLRKKHAGD